MEIFANRPLPHCPLPASLPAAPPWLPAATPLCRSVPLSLGRHCSLLLSPTTATATPYRPSAALRPLPLPPVAPLPPSPLCAASLPPRPSLAEARVVDPGGVIQAVDLADGVEATEMAVTAWRRGTEARVAPWGRRQPWTGLGLSFYFFLLIFSFCAVFCCFLLFCLLFTRRSAFF
ncbi:hypothetical protein PVAP13_8KG278202 [Panicum virgatum]|uniref:Uncharacterized protein n=1 Tax=Panicum virgatum TaxID=38727 RepID=A0A8T0PMG6_PANVG|nr:hypothetical protein PVAP13_8KG278202 [Panicum virgatum]